MTVHFREPFLTPSKKLLAFEVFLVNFQSFEYRSILAISLNLELFFQTSRQVTQNIEQKLVDVSIRVSMKINSVVLYFDEILFFPKKKNTSTNSSDFS
ncbi:hypothetical protein BpHYR1_040735 [Brachionus plicatilis]|uniref:Uncharacterized protein n=1 Tax=Brachionus plicatilis TaxID=10195 RepID=A0A3M7RRL4_BRAPC|nr:hypothetical protein BpHYR1_040735 [Brachionus plicatilis]